jgi:hypothetical protein
MDPPAGCGGRISIRTRAFANQADTGSREENASDKFPEPIAGDGCRQINAQGMIDMKTQIAGIAIAALLSIGSSLPGYAEDAVAPKDTAAPAATQTEAPTSVPRPSIAPKTAEPASPPAAAEPAPRRHRRYARHHYRRYAYWEPFPIYWPRIHRHHFYWSRISWFGF